MKVLSQDKKSVKLELSPLELHIFVKAIQRESRRHEHNWEKCNPQYPEELVYYADMKEVSRHMKVVASDSLKRHNRKK